MVDSYVIFSFSDRFYGSTRWNSILCGFASGHFNPTSDLSDRQCCVVVSSSSAALFLLSLAKAAQVHTNRISASAPVSLNLVKKAKREGRYWQSHLYSRCATAAEALASKP